MTSLHGAQMNMGSVVLQLDRKFQFIMVLSQLILISTTSHKLRIFLLEGITQALWMILADYLCVAKMTKDSLELVTLIMS